MVPRLPCLCGITVRLNSPLNGQAHAGPLGRGMGASPSAYHFPRNATFAAPTVQQRSATHSRCPRLLLTSSAHFLLSLLHARSGLPFAFHQCPFMYPAGLVTLSIRTDVSANPLWSVDQPCTASFCHCHTVFARSSCLSCDFLMNASCRVFRAV